MKKLAALLIAGMMVLALAACGGGKDDPAPPDASDPGTSQQQEQPPSNTPSTPAEDETSSGAGTTEPENSDTSGMEERLNRAGLTFESLEPDQEYVHSIFDGYNIKFFFTSDASLDVGAYYYQVMDACKAASDDGKIYETTSGTFSGSGDEAEFQPKAQGDYFELDAALIFGIYHDGKPATISVMMELDNDKEQDNKTCPAFSILIK